MNKLLWGSVAVAVTYVAAGLLIPAPYLSLATSSFLLGAGFLLWWKYAEDAIDVLIRGRRSTEPGGEGAHLAVYGMFLIAGGSVYVGLYGLVWNLMGSPEEWVGTWFSAMGRGLLGAGFILMMMAPDRSRKEVYIPNLWLLSLIGGAAIVVAFLLGSQIRGLEANSWYPVNSLIPMCSPYRDVWGSSSGLYHTPESRYRGTVIPRYCFESEEEAQQYGFRAPASSGSILQPVYRRD